MDQNKLRQFISKALQSGHDEESIVNFIKSQIKPDLISPLPKGEQQLGQNQNPVSNTVSNLASLVAKYFPQDQIQNALKVIQGESGGDPNAIGDNYPIRGETIPSYGLFQIRGLPGRPDKQTLLNPEENVKYAAQLYKQQNWRPWTAARKLGLVN